MSTYIDHLKRTSLAGVLRTAGALVVVAGLCSHLLEGWNDWADLSRLYVLLGLTGAFTMSGFAISAWLKEHKGARVFVSLGLIAVVASLTTLGGLLEDIVSWRGLLNGGGWWVDAVALQAYSPGLIAGVLALVVLTLVPVTSIAFRVLARPQAKQLSWLFAVCSLLICIPVRQSWPLGLIILISLVLPGYYAARALQQQLVFATHEGRFALVSLFFPAIVMLARLFWLYEADVLLTWMLLCISFVAIHGLRLQHRSSATCRGTLSFAGLMVAMGVTLTTMILLDAVIALELLLPLGGLLFASAVYWSGMVHPRVKSGCEVLAGLCVAVAVVVNLLIHDTWLAVAAGVLVGLLVCLCGRRWDNQPVVVTGAVLLLASLLSQLVELGRHIDFTHWLTLGVTGMCLLGVAVVVEKRTTSSAAELTDDVG
ncbi:MAG: hypothetical protein ACFHXK_06240 [bacterium]